MIYYYCSCYKQGWMKLVSQQFSGLKKKSVTSDAENDIIAHSRSPLWQPAVLANIQPCIKSNIPELYTFASPITAFIISFCIGRACYEKVFFFFFFKCVWPREQLTTAQQEMFSEILTFIAYE